MVDHLTAEKRSWNMSRIRSKHTKPERLVRSLLHCKGYRFRLHRGDLPGKPDIVLPKYHTVVFVHGCFWHRHAGCANATMPKTRTEWWQQKFRKNVERDAKHRAELKELGWNVVVVWECETKNLHALAARLDRIIKKREAVYTAPGTRVAQMAAEEKAEYKGKATD